MFPENSEIMIEAGRYFMWQVHYDNPDTTDCKENSLLYIKL